MHFNAFNATYRAYRSPWTGTPATAPALAARTSRGKTTGWASWNGSTALHRWRVLGGSSAKRLKAVGGGAKRSFETSFKSDAATPTSPCRRSTAAAPG